MFFRVKFVFIFRFCLASQVITLLAIQCQRNWNVSCALCSSTSYIPISDIPICERHDRLYMAHSSQPQPTAHRLFVVCQAHVLRWPASRVLFSKRQLLRSSGLNGIWEPHLRPPDRDPTADFLLTNLYSPTHNIT